MWWDMDQIIILALLSLDIFGLMTMRVWVRCTDICKVTIPIENVAYINVLCKYSHVCHLS